jgi:hypothetical protein
VNGATVIATSGDPSAYVVVTNTHASNNLFLGGPDITATNYGISVAANGGTASFYLAEGDKLYAFTTGNALPTTTGTAATNVFSSTTHGMAIGDMVVFTALTGGTGLSTNKVYYVIADSFGASAFKLSEASGGAEVNFTTDVTVATVYTGTNARVFISGGF